MGVTKHLCHHILSYPRYIICHTVLLLIRQCPSQHLEHSPSCPPGIYLKRWCSVCLVCLLSVCVWFWRSCTAVIKLTQVSVSSATDGEMDQFALIHKRWQQLQTLLFLSVALCRHPAATRARCITLFKSCKSC